MCTIIKTEKGYSLVEVLIAISILMLAIVGPLTIAAKSIQTAQYARQQTTAFFLAQEGITIMNIIRNEYALQAYNSAGPTPDSWAWTIYPAAPANTVTTLARSCFQAAGCGIDLRDRIFMDNDVVCTPAVTNPCTIKLRPANTNTTVTSLYTHLNGGAATPYTRIIRLTPQGASEVLVSVEVRWNTTYLGGTTQSVVLQTSLFDIYEDL